MAYFYRLRIRDASDASDALIVTSSLSSTNPYISEPPSGDGMSFDPRTGATQVGAYTVRIADNGGAANAITGFLSDGNGRYDKLGRRAWLEYGTDGTTFPTTLVVGYITGISYASAAEAVVSIGEAQRSERLRQAFTRASGTTTGAGTVSATGGAATFSLPQAGVLANGDLIAVAGAPYTVSAFNGTTGCTLSGAPTFGASAFSITSTAFPATTMLGGGPVRWPAGVVTPVNMPNRGPWTMKSVAGGYTAAATLLRFVSGYVLADENAVDYTRSTSGAFPPYMRRRINTLVAAEVPGAPLVGTGVFALVQLGNVYADVSANGTVIGTFPLMIGSYENGQQTAVLNQADILLFWTNTDPVGTQYQVYIYTLTVSENAPLHVVQHPITIVTGLITQAGERFDATTAAAVTALVGADVRLFLRLTASMTTDEAITKLLGFFGIGRRINSANAWEFFDARSKSTSAPGTTIAQSDLREIPSNIWSLSDSTIINTVTVTTQRFALWAPGQSQTRPPDGLIPVEQKRTARFQLADGTYPDTSQGIKEQSYDLPGLILNANGGEVDPTNITMALAASTFDRWGFGAPSTAFKCLTTVAANIGDEVLLNLPFLPNASVRGGQRIVQILQRTNEPGGSSLVVEDAGLSAQPSLAPTFTVTQSPTNTDTRADVTLTNAAALVAAGVVSVLVEWAVSALSPTVAGQDLGAILPVSPVVLTTPGANPGVKVWARAKSIQPGKRSGTFTSWAGVTLTSAGAPTSLAFTADPTDGARGTLSWIAGTTSSTYTVEVLLRPSALTSASDLLAVALLPGSVNGVLEGLTPSASYTATVRYVDPSTGAVGASTSLTFSAGATVVTLPAPTNARGIVGSTDLVTGVQRIDGTYGLDVTAAVLPGTIEFWGAVEPTVGAGYYTTPVLLAALPAKSGGLTSYRTVAPNDGLRRQLTARHVRQGATASPFTFPVSVAPWGAIAGPPPDLQIPIFQWSDSATTRTITGTVGVGVTSVWIYDTTIAVGGGSGWPVTGQLPTSVIVTSGSFSYDAVIPPVGFQRFVQMEPRNDAGDVGQVRKTIIDYMPVFSLGIRARIVATATATVTVRVAVSDPYPQASATITYQELGTGGVAPASGGTVTPAATLAEDVGTYIDYTVTRPAPGANGRVVFAAAAAFRQPAIASVDVPALDGIPQGTISILSDGSVQLSVDGAAWVASYKYATSTTAFPSDATAMAGTTLNGRQATVSLGAATLALGDTIYATFVPYSVTGAAGTAGSSVRLRATRHDATDTTTTFSTFASVSEGYQTFGLGLWRLNGGYVSNFNWPGSYPSSVWGTRLDAILTIPNGVTITGLSADMYLAVGAPASVALRLESVDNTGATTAIATVTTTTTGWQTKTATCSETTTGKNYRVVLAFDGGAPMAGQHYAIDDDLRASLFSYTYTRPSTSKVI